jgi:membrane protein
VKLFKFVKQVFQEFEQDKAGQMSAAFAYTAIFAIGPLLLVLISIVGFIYGEKAASGQLFNSLKDVVGLDAAKTIQDVVANTHQSGKNVLAFAVGVVVSLLAAAALTSQLQNSFNNIFRIVPDPKAGIKRIIYVRLKNILILASGGVILVASTVLSAVASGLGHRVQNTTPTGTIEAINTAVSLLVFIGILYLLYRVLPDVHIPRRIVICTAVAVSLLFMLGKIVLGFVIGRNGTASAYGAAASLVVLLLWFYYSAQILILGAEGMKVYGLRHSLVYKPKLYNLKRRSFNIDTKDDFIGEILAAFSRESSKKSKK